MSKELIVWKVGAIIMGTIVGGLIFIKQDLESTIKEQEKVIEILNIDCEWTK